MEQEAALGAVFMPGQPPSTFEETVERLGTAIRLGLLTPGSRLPPERDLAKQLRISRSTLRQALTTLVQSGHLVSLRGRSGGTFVAAEPPLVDPIGEPLDVGAWEVLDQRVAIEAGAVPPAARRAPSAGGGRGPARRRAPPGPAVRPPRPADRGDVGADRGLRGVPPHRPALPHRPRRGGGLAAPGPRDDRRAGADDRPDRADPAPARGAGELERAAREDRQGAPPRGRAARRAADARAHRGHRAHPRRPAAGAGSGPDPLARL